MALYTRHRGVYGWVFPLQVSSSSPELGRVAAVEARRHAVGARERGADVGHAFYSCGSGWAESAQFSISDAFLLFCYQIFL